LSGQAFTYFQMPFQIETPPVSWLGGSLGFRQDLIDGFKTSTLPSHPGSKSLGYHRDLSPKTVASAENFPALQSRVGDGFSPSSHARSLVLL
jgi:hypothetical protein